MYKLSNSEFVYEHIKQLCHLVVLQGFGKEHYIKIQSGPIKC